MLEPVKHILNAQRIILASGSPRRKQILENIGLKFEVIPSTFAENLDKRRLCCPNEYAKATARHKALDIASKERQIGDRVPDLVIGADTVVAMDNRIIEKPASKEHAYEILSSIAGRMHTVYTGVVMVTPGEKAQDDFVVHEFHEATDVFMCKMTPEVIQAYIDTGEPMDKAGAYGIQGIGGTLVSSINGDYFNVMGFPLHHFCIDLLKMPTLRILSHATAGTT